MPRFYGLEVTRSSGHTSRQRRIEKLLQQLQLGDRLLVTELSRLGRSTVEVILLIDQLVGHCVTLVIIKQNLHVGQGLQDMTAKVMITLLALFAEIEHDFISLRTREALAAKKAQGVVLGKPKEPFKRVCMTRAVTELRNYSHSVSGISKSWSGISIIAHQKV